MNNKFWNVKTDGDQSSIDLFGYVGGSKEYNYGFNEEDFLNEFRSIPSDNALNISINSFGGSVFTALSIYSLLQTHKGSITIRVDGVAMSAATIITSVPNAKVVMPKGSIMMIHKVSSGVYGNSEEMRKAADDIDKIEENIINIYVDKCKKPKDEIKQYVDAETYFTAKEAVEFGLADEIDESQTIENKANGDVVMINGLEVKASIFEHAPKGIFNAGKAAILNTNKKENKMDLEKLKAEYPDLVEAIRNEAMNEGVNKERARIQAIEEIAIVGHEKMVNDAKFDNAITAEQLAVAILKADKARSQNALKDRVNDAEELSNLPNDEGNEGIIPNAELKLKEDAERKAIIEAAAKTFSNKK